jgi:xanthine dehydrogenase YagS FAD-binding subunit
MLPAFAYVRATTVADAVRQLTAPGARVHAGGTDLLGCLRDGVFTAQSLVSIGRLKELSGISAMPASAGGLRIGATTTHSQIAADKTINQSYRALAQAAAAVASPQLRNQGTIGGNLCQRPRCWYFRGDFHCARKGGEHCFAVGGENQNHAVFGGGACVIVHPSDTAPALIALGAKVRIAGPGQSRVVPLSSFFVGPAASVTSETILQKNEIVTEILLPAVEPGLRSSYRKVRGRGAWDFALAGIAVALLMKGGTVARARVVFSGVAPVPWRSEAVEQAITGKALTADVAGAAAEAGVKGATPLEKNGYKVPMLRGIITDALLALA